jgi:DNA polymerase-3 subunit alpha
MPDFDIDFCQENRHRAIEYVQAKYGTDKVAAIITFGKLQARAVLKDVGRVLQMPYSQVDKISKMIPFNPVEPVTLEKAISLDPELKSQQASDPDLAKLLDIGLKLEGLNRHSSTHAAGIIIGGKSLIELVPLSKDEGHELPVVGYNMKAAEKAGLVKFDFLGLKTLTVIANTVKLVKEIRDIQVDISKIDMFDKATFELLQSGHTRGVFQLDSVICKDAMKQMKIGDIKEIIALTSLNRPGPMENIPSYIARKIGKEAVEYPHPLLTQVLGETFGIIIYQEQVMQVAQILAGYTLGQADLLRRAMGKKIKEEMDAQRAIFVDGAVKNSVEGKKASEIFDLVEKFAGYGFNKSHAAAYSVISYQTAYLKAHYPIEFFTAYLNIAINDTDDLNLFVSEARQMGIEITLPDVNESEAKFTIQNGRIIYALGALKAVGIGIIEELVQIRKTSGIFRDIFDFCGRVGAKIANKRAIESFAKVGAFDKIYPNRREIVENVAKLTAFAANHQKELETACVGLFGDEVSAGIEPPKLDKFADYTQIERFMAEFEAVGYYLSAHPLSAYTAELEANGIVQSDKLEEIVSEKEVKIKMAGVISIVRQRSGKRGRFAFVHLSDLGGIYETCIFSDKLITQKRDLIKEGTLVYAEVAVQKQENGAARIIINELHALSEFVKNPRLASQKVQNMPQPKPPVITPALEPIPEPKIEPKLEAKIVRFLVKKPQHIKAFAQNLAKYKSESGTQVILEINNHKFHLYNQNYNLTTSDIQNLSEIIN